MRLVLTMKTASNALRIQDHFHAVDATKAVRPADVREVCPVGAIKSNNPPWWTGQTYRGVRRACEGCEEKSIKMVR